MNLADTKLEFHSVVARCRANVPLDAADKARAVAELARVHQLAMKRIDRYTVETQGRRSRFLSINERQGLVDKLDSLHAAAAAELDLSEYRPGYG
jgi:hypothetical protein